MTAYFGSYSTPATGNWNTVSNWYSNPGGSKSGSSSLGRLPNSTDTVVIYNGSITTGPTSSYTTSGAIYNQSNGLHAGTYTAQYFGGYAPATFDLGGTATMNAPAVSGGSYSAWVGGSATWNMGSTTGQLMRALNISGSAIVNISGTLELQYTSSTFAGGTFNGNITTLVGIPSAITILNIANGAVVGNIIYNYGSNIMNGSGSVTGNVTINAGATLTIESTFTVTGNISFGPILTIAGSPTINGNIGSTISFSGATAPTYSPTGIYTIPMNFSLPQKWGFTNFYNFPVDPGFAQAGGTYKPPTYTVTGVTDVLLNDGL